MMVDVETALEKIQGDLKIAIEDKWCEADLKALRDIETLIKGYVDAQGALFSIASIAKTAWGGTSRRYGRLAVIEDIARNNLAPSCFDAVDDRDLQIAGLMAENDELKRDFLHLARGKVSFEYADGYHTPTSEDSSASYEGIIDDLGPREIEEIHSYVTVKGPTKFCFSGRDGDRHLYDTLAAAEAALPKGGQ